MRIVLVFIILAAIAACGKKPPEKHLDIVSLQEPFIIDIAGTTLYVVPIKMNKGQCYITAPNSDAPGFHCDFVREK